MLCRKPEDGHFDFMEEQGLGFIAFSPLAQGLLTNRYINGIPDDSRVAKSGVFLHREDITPEMVEKIKKLDAIAANRGQSLAQMSLAWILNNNVVTSVIIGASSVSQLDDNLQAAANTPFSPEEISEIDRIIG